MRDAYPRAVPDDPRYFLRVTHCPNGDPSKATAWVDARTRTGAALSALCAHSAPSHLEQALATFTGHSPATTFPTCPERAATRWPMQTRSVGRAVFRPSWRLEQLPSPRPSKPLPSRSQCPPRVDRSPCRPCALPPPLSPWCLRSRAATPPATYGRRALRPRDVTRRRRVVARAVTEGYTSTRHSRAQIDSTAPRALLLLQHRNYGEDAVAPTTRVSGTMGASYDGPHPSLEDTRAQVP
mmetsp:Transcript_23168/g.55851  ORF Transcript_23168/g.55851 Transcript_23168/m.55851 type:complete len:239 (-) Transcript_23168:15-731(-)